VLEWLRRLGAPKSGPDYRHVDSRKKAEELCKRGTLQKLLLVPAEFGGQDVPPNVVYVPAMAVELKTRMDLATIRPMAEKGLARTYTATPAYEGNSVVPVSISVCAADPGRFEGVINIWGRALEQQPVPVPTDQPPKQPIFRLSSAPVEGLEPADFVRAYIDDYESWNSFANDVYADDSDAGFSAAESAYAALIAKYCPPGHRHQPVSFGSDASHDNKREAIVGVEPTAEGCIVKTRHTKVFGTLVVAHDHEYHLKHAGHRWFLTSVLYVDQDGKYEGL